MKAIMGNIGSEPGNKFHSKYQAKLVTNDPKSNLNISTNPVEKLHQEVQVQNKPASSSTSSLPQKLPAPHPTSPETPPKQPVLSAAILPESSTSHPISTVTSQILEPATVINNSMSSLPTSSHQPSKPTPAAQTATTPSDTVVQQTSTVPVQPKLMPLFPSVSVPERIIYINDALSGLHGGKLKSLAQDIYRSRRAVYENNKRKLDDSNLHDLLEQHADDYMKWQYQTKYSVLENPFVPSDPMSFQHLTFEKSDQARPSMQEAIAALRKVNLNIAKSHNKYAARYESSSVLGKRTPLLADATIGEE